MCGGGGAGAGGREPWSRATNKLSTDKKKLSFKNLAIKDN